MITCLEVNVFMCVCVYVCTFLCVYVFTCPCVNVDVYGRGVFVCYLYVSPMCMFVGACVCACACVVAFFVPPGIESDAYGKAARTQTKTG